jgi:hypothetical protein
MSVSSEIWSIPNLLTLLRILITTVIVVSFYFEDAMIAHRIASGLFLDKSTRIRKFLTKRGDLITKIGPSPVHKVFRQP